SQTSYSNRSYYISAYRCSIIDTPINTYIMSNLSILRGDAAVWDVAITDPTNSNAAVDLTSKLLRFTCKHSYVDSDTKAVFQVTATPSSAGSIVTGNDPTLGL